eukprot:TRINITY_DN66435_c0_g1_i1.p1 TRINITY_DN66435_c0_g1~~TRINITY_DN66435_c0_g1_i1.p1  ORF type:complete len:116 (-),score=6.49 TRINITY_DN66435_c0_g1_i1:80-427(-)
MVLKLLLLAFYLFSKHYSVDKLITMDILSVHDTKPMEDEDDARYFWLVLVACLSALSTSGGLYLAFNIGLSPKLRSRPGLMLVFWRAISDIGICLKYLLLLFTPDLEITREEQPA